MQWIIFTLPILPISMSFVHPTCTPGLLRKAHQKPCDASFGLERKYGHQRMKVSASQASEGISRKTTKDHARVQAIHTFLSEFEASLGDNTFVSFTLRGPKSPRKRKNKKGGTGTDFDAVEKEKERLRGSIRSVHGRLIALHDKKSQSKGRKAGSDTDGTGEDVIYLQTTFKFHGATDVAQNLKVAPSTSAARDGSEARRCLFRLLLPNSVDEEEAGEQSSEWGTSVLTSPELGIRVAELEVAGGVWNLDLAGKRARIRFVGKKRSGNEAAIGTVLSHDRAKNVPLSPSEPFFQKLGVSNVEGKPRAGMASKLRQCQKFVEIVGGLVDSTVATLPSAHVSSLSTTDMGCGRGYLTFALHSYLMKKFGAEECGIKSRGIEVRPKLVAETNAIARELGDGFDTLHFAEGTIENVMLGGASGDGETESEDGNLDILIALHACDTATDDALWCGVRRGSDIIVSAPCCHKEVRRQLDPYVAKVKMDHPLADVLRHNIYRERMAETATDSIRALLLELANYSVQVFEFIGGEHTSKNVMITAQKRRTPRNQEELAQLRSRLQSLAALHGVTRQRLAHWMNESLTGVASDVVDTGDQGPKESHLSGKRMPPHIIDPID